MPHDVPPCSCPDSAIDRELNCLLCPRHSMRKTPRLVRACRENDQLRSALDEGAWTEDKRAAKKSAEKIEAERKAKVERQRRQWLALHSFDLNPWSLGRASAWFYGSWMPSIHRCIGCGSQLKSLLSRMPPDFSSSQAFFEWGWLLHNTVSVEHASNPPILLDEAYSLYRPQAYTAGSLDWCCVALTAISRLPKHLERQAKCFDSWRQFGLTIYAMNTRDEIEQLRPIYPQISHWIEQNETAANYTYPTQLIRNMAGLANRINRRVLLINSDIEIYGRQAALTDHIRDGQQTYFIRWNYATCEPRASAKEFQWGLDAVSFTPEQAAMLPDDFPYAIGHAMWDYAVPYFTLKGGEALHFPHERLFYHEDHPTHWNQQSWQFGADWLTANTELKVDRELPAALWRESLDPDHYYDKDRGLYVPKNGQQSVSRFTGPTLASYQRWRMVQSDRGTFRHGESAAPRRDPPLQSV